MRTFRDLTPQEFSEAISRIGMASVKAIAEHFPDLDAESLKFLHFSAFVGAVTYHPVFKTEAGQSYLWDVLAKCSMEDVGMAPTLDRLLQGNGN